MVFVKTVLEIRSSSSILQRNHCEWIFIISWFQALSHSIPFLSSPRVCSSSRVFLIFSFSFLQVHSSPSIYLNPNPSPSPLLPPCHPFVSVARPASPFWIWSTTPRRKSDVGSHVGSIRRKRKRKTWLSSEKSHKKYSNNFRHIKIVKPLLATRRYVFLQLTEDEDKEKKGD